MLLGLALAADIDATGSNDEDRRELPVGGAIDPGQLPIINGSPATRNQFPSAGGLIVQADLSGFPLELLMCTSTLIAPDVVLTAGHCVDLQAFLDTYGYDGLTVTNQVFGWSQDPDLTDYTELGGASDWPEGTAIGSTAIQHPDFDLLSVRPGLAENHDIALVFLDEPVLDVPFAWLPTAEEGAALATGDPVTIVGWGQQTTSPTSVGEKIIAESVIGEIANFEVQIGDSPDDGRKCHGDSGGPTYYQVPDSADEDPFRVIGVTSHSFDVTDCDSKGGVDTRVDFYLDWIEAQLTKGCEDGIRSWCDQTGIPKQRSAGPETASVLSDDEKGGCDTAAASPTAIAALLGLLAVRRKR
jgi:hypothetical protein